MKTEFANSDDVKAYIDKRTLKEVRYNYRLWHWRFVTLVFDDGSYINLSLEDCDKFKLCKWTFYCGRLIVKSVNGIKPNYELYMKNNELRNLIIDGINLENDRLDNVCSEVFTNTVRENKDINFNKNNTVFKGVSFKCMEE